MLSSKDKEKPSRLSLGQLSRLQESTQRNADDIFGAIVDPSSSPKPAATPPTPVPAFRAVTEEPKKDVVPVAASPSPAPALQAVPAPAPQPAAEMAPAAGEGEGERPVATAAKPVKRAKHAPKGEPCSAHPGESKRENLVSVRFTPEQMEDLEHWAEAERLPLAVMCRDIILKEMHRNRALIQKIREFRQALTKTA